MGVSAIDDHLGYWLRVVSNHVSHGFARSVQAKGVTVAEWVVLRALYESGAVAPSALAGSMGMTRGAISKLADRLEAKKLAVRSRSEGDRRFQELRLTGAGRALVPELAALADANDAAAFGGLTPEEARTLRMLLEKIVQRRGIRGVAVD